jgi:hypothetical protein
MALVSAAKNGPMAMIHVSANHMALAAKEKPDRGDVFPPVC